MQYEDVIQDKELHITETYARKQEIDQVQWANDTQFFNRWK